MLNSPDWRTPTINPENTGDKSFQYLVTFALHYEGVESHSGRASSIKPFINKYNWKGINNPSNIDDWKKFEKNNLKNYS